MISSTILAGVVYLISLQQVLPDSVPAFIVGRTDPRIGSPTRMWIFVPQSQADSVVLKLMHDSTVVAWFPVDHSGCGRPSGRTNDTIRTDIDQLRTVCVTTDRPGTVRLLAGIDPFMPGENSSVIVSETIGFEAEPPSSPALLAILSAIAGLIAGLCTVLVQGEVSRRQAKRETTSKIHATVLDHILPQLRSNLQLLRAHAEGKRLDERADLGAYQAIILDDGVMGFLRQSDKRAYLNRYERLIRELESYNRRLDTTKKISSDVATTERSDLIVQLTKLTGSKE